VLELAEAYETARVDPAFQERFASELRVFAGRPTPLTPAPRFAARALADALRTGRLDRSTTEQSVARVTALQDKLGLVPGDAELSAC
jgi:hypothetical protein